MTVQKFEKISILVVFFSAIFGSIIGSYLSFYLLEQETHSELKLISVNYENELFLSNNNQTENVKLIPTIVLYNTKSSNYPAKLFPARQQIIDDQTHEIIRDRPTGLDESQSIILPGDTVTFNHEISMPLCKTGNYTLQTIIYYLDVESGLVKTLEFYFGFQVEPNKNKFDSELYPYSVRLYNEYNPHEKQWKTGKKFPIISENSRTYHSIFECPVLQSLRTVCLSDGS